MQNVSTNDLTARTGVVASEKSGLFAPNHQATSILRAWHMVDSGPISWQRTLFFRHDSPKRTCRSDIRRIPVPGALWVIEI
jgi:hypothetical protein